MVPYRKEISLLALVLIIVSGSLVCRYQRITEEAVEMFLIGVLLIWYRCRQEDKALAASLVPAPAQPVEQPHIVTMAVFEPIEAIPNEVEEPLPMWLEELLKDGTERK